MPATAVELSADQITYSLAARENSGRAMCDSGDFYGRHYEAPPVPSNAPIVSADEFGVCIHTAPWLDEIMEIDRMKQQLFEAFCDQPQNAEMSWWEVTKAFFESMGYTQAARDNVYNCDQDLDQMYVWEVYVPKGSDQDDWYYNEKAVTAIYMHTGCDVRGGYSRPVFGVLANDEYPLPMDVVVGVQAIGLVLDEEREEIDREWQIGYSQWPLGQFEDDVEKVYEFTRHEGTVIVKLNSGHVVKVQFVAPYVW